MTTTQWGGWGKGGARWGSDSAGREQRERQRETAQTEGKSKLSIETLGLESKASSAVVLKQVCAVQGVGLNHLITQGHILGMADVDICPGCHLKRGHHTTEQKEWQGSARSQSCRLVIW